MTPLHPCKHKEVKGMKRVVPVAAAVLAASVVLTGVTACSSSSNGGSGGGGTSALDAALKKGGTLTYWSWSTAAKAKVAAFEAAYPQVKVKWANVASGGDEYVKLTNAIKAGSGVPDAVQFEYTALPQFELAKDLVDLSKYGMGSVKSEFSSGAWSNVVSGKSIYALPEDSGPMALLYNKAIFDKYGIAVPKTWDEFAADAQKLHQADPNEYLTSDGGDGLFASSMIWQAGGHPYSVDGTKVTVNLQDAGTKKWTAVWNKLVEGKLLAPTPSYSDDWYKQLGNGQIASLVSAAWMPGLLESSAAPASGNWRVAPMPTYDGGKAASANYGGSAEAVTKQSKNPALAAAFIKWINTSDAGVQALIDSGAFPSTVKQLEASALADQAPKYFGGQKINQIFLAASQNVPSGWQYLPYQTYAQTIFPDTVGQSYASHSDLNTGLQKWQDALVKYGKEQGFSVTGT